MKKASELATVRYTGRALTLVNHGRWSRHNGHDVFEYFPPESTGHYLVDVEEEVGICDCDEYKINLHLMQAVAEGERVWRNPGPICKHIIAAWALAGHLNVLAVCEDLPDGLKEEARKAYKEQKTALVA